MKPEIETTPRWLTALVDVLGLVVTFGAVSLMVLAILTAFGSGCAHVANTGPAFDAMPAPYIPPPRPELAPLAGECSETVALRAGESRDCVSLSKAPHISREEAAVIDVAASTERALVKAYAGWEIDRESANLIIESRETQLAVARANQPRLFMLGVGVGVGAAVSVALAVALGGR